MVFWFIDHDFLSTFWLLFGELWKDEPSFKDTLEL
jgi:hypothetical protein